MNYISLSESFEELLRRDGQREKDGFPKRIKIRRILIGPNKFISIPYVEDEKLIHGNFEPTSGRGRDEAGNGEGNVGDIIGRVPASGEDGEGESGSDGAGSGEGEHGSEADAYELGKTLIEEFELPNLKDKGKKVPTHEYTYKLTDRHRGSGQLLDKKETLRRIVKTNLLLGLFDENDIDISKLVVAPQDKIFRVLSRERVWKSQAIVFFLRDFSGSMMNDPTEVVVNQHLLLYAWLMYQYEKLVIPRFIVHEISAKEVSVGQYFKLNSGGGTAIVSGYKKINELVEEERLDRDYNIFVFQGTDGDDGGNREETIAELEKILSYVNRMGAVVIKDRERETTFEAVVKQGNFQQRKNIFRLHAMPSHNVTREMHIEALKALISDDK